MFKQLFRLTFVTFIWSRYKAVIVSTILLFMFFWLTHKVHADFLTYSKLQGESENIGLSFIIKWGVLIAGIVLYFIYNHLVSRYSKNKPKNKAKQVVKKAIKDDPFDEIRKKDKLKSKADFILNKNDTTKK